MISLTKSAENAVKSAISAAAQPVKGLRIMVEGAAAPVQVRNGACR